MKAIPLEIKRLLSSSDDVYAIAKPLGVYKFNFWLHYNDSIEPGYPWHWSIFGNKSGTYFDNESEMIEDLQEYWERLILSNLQESKK